MRCLMTVLLWILLAAAALMTGMGFFLAHFSMTIRRQTFWNKKSTYGNPLFFCPTPQSKAYYSL